MTSEWTLEDMPTLTNKVALVTGANGGLGLETARGLAARGAQVVLACRGAEKAQQAMEQIRATVPKAKLEFAPLDLSDLASVRACAANFKVRHSRLHILCNNAGVMGLPYAQTKDGFEMLFGTNHLGHFALTGELLDMLIKSPHSRVVTVSSVAHKIGKLHFEDLNWEKRRYSRRGAYGQSKLANLMFAIELDRRLRKAGLDVISVASHPGYSSTNIGFSGSGKESFVGRMVTLGNNLIAQTADRGALPSLYAATAEDVQGGDYIGPEGPLEFRGPPVRVHPRPKAKDEAAAAHLWKLSEEMTDVRYL